MIHERTFCFYHFFYVQNELDYGGEGPHQQHSQQPTMHSNMNLSPHLSAGSFGQATVGAGGGHHLRSVHTDHQVKNSVFSNALSSPVRRSLQHYQLSQVAFQNSSSNDSNMEMHADSPDHDSAYWLMMIVFSSTWVFSAQVLIQRATYRFWWVRPILLNGG